MIPAKTMTEWSKADFEALTIEDIKKLNADEEIAKAERHKNDIL